MARSSQDVRQTIAAFKAISQTVDMMPEADFTRMIETIYTQAVNALDDVGDELDARLIPVGFCAVLLPIIAHRFTGGRITFDFTGDVEQGVLSDD